MFPVKTQRPVEKSLSYGPKKRIKKRSDFLEAQNKGGKFKTKSLLLCFLPKDSHQSSAISIRLGITVTTKVHKRAVKRNRVKRILREIFRKQYSEFRKRGDLVVILMKGGVDRSYAELHEEFNFAIRKMHLIDS